MSLITPTKSADDPCRCKWHDDRLGLGQPCEAFDKHPRASWCLVCGHASSCHQQPRTDRPRQAEDVLSNTVDFSCPREPLGLPCYLCSNGGSCRAETPSEAAASVTAGCSRFCVDKADADKKACRAYRSTVRCNWCSHWAECHVDTDIARTQELEAALLEWVDATDAPARSNNRSESSVWLARVTSAEDALRAAVGEAPKHPGATGLPERAAQLETEASALRARSADLLEALTALIARAEKTGGYSTPEEQDALRLARWVRDGGGR